MRIATYRNIAGSWDVPFDPDLDSPATLVLAFGGRDQEAALAALLAAHPQAVALGCSTAGQILDAGIGDGGLTAAVVRLERTRLVRSAAPLPDTAGSRGAGRAIAEDLAAGAGLRAVFVLSTGLNVNGSELVRGLNEVLPEDVVVTGGLAADDANFERTWVLQDGAPRSGWATAVGFYGEHARVGHGCRGGWDIFGPQRLVTRSQGNVLYELDERPALDLYRQYLGELADGLPATALRFPLALRPQPDSDRQLVRSILSVDEENRSMTFAGDIPQGALAQLMRANFDRLVAGAELAAQLTRASEVDDGPCLAIAISCVGRRMVLGEGSEEEVEATLDFLPPRTRQIGFYGYGELSPYSTGPCDLHNQTMSVTTVQEVDGP